MGRNGQNKAIVFDAPSQDNYIGKYLWVEVERCTSATLFGHVVPAPPSDEMSLPLKKFIQDKIRNI